MSKVSGQKKQSFQYLMKVLRGEVKLHRRELTTPSQGEDAYFGLLKYASEHVDALISAFRDETDPSVKMYLLELIGEARSPKALPVLTEVIRSDDEALWSWAIYALRDLKSHEARKVLWEARSYVKETQELTDLFQETVADCSRFLVWRDGMWEEAKE